jgi:hypothetical protein
VGRRLAATVKVKVLAERRVKRMAESIIVIQTAWRR